MTAAIDGQRCRPPPRLGQLVLLRHAHPAARAARRHVRGLCLLPRGRRHRRRRRRPRPSGSAQLAAMAARHRRALCRRSAGQLAQPGAGGRALSACAREDFLAVIDGMEMDVRADIRAPDLEHARSLLRPRRQRRRPASRARLRHGRSTTASRSRIISAAPCSSPTCCAISTRTPPIGRLYLPRELLQQAGIDVDRPASRACASARSAPPARGGRRGARAFRAGRRDHGALPAPPGARAAHHGAKPIAASCEDWSRAAGRRRAPRPGQQRSHLLQIALRHAHSSDGRTFTSSAPALPGLSAAVRLAAGAHVVVHEAARSRRRPLPLLSRRRARHDDRQRQPCDPVGQSRRARLSRTDRRATGGLHGPADADFTFVDLATDRALDSCASATAAVPGGSSTSAGACRTRARPIICRWRG